MFSRKPVALVLSLTLVGVAFAGCGSSDNTDQKIKDAAAAAAAQQKLKDQQAHQGEEVTALQKEIRSLQKQLQKDQNSSKSTAPTSSSGGSGGGGSSGGSGGASVGASCGGGLSVGPNTTCGFARNVRDAYYQAGGGDATIVAGSPTTGQLYTMTCVAGAPTICRGGNNATVYIR